MKAKVLKAFLDKENKKKRYTTKNVFDGKKERVEELQKLGYVGEPIEEAEQEVQEEKTKKKKSTKESD